MLTEEVSRTWNRDVRFAQACLRTFALCCYRCDANLHRNDESVAPQPEGPVQLLSIVAELSVKRNPAVIIHGMLQELPLAKLLEELG